MLKKALLMAALVLCLTASAHAAGPACDAWAAPRGSDSAPGTRDQPKRSAQALLDSLQSGETGCLAAGTYTNPDRPGYSLYSYSKPDVRLRSQPGQRARLVGTVYVPPEVRGLVLRDLDIDVSQSELWSGVGIDGDRVRMVGLDIDGGKRHNCVHVGWEKADVRFFELLRSRLANCGADSQFDHGIYVNTVRGGRVVGNLFEQTSAFAVHLYPNADRVQVAGNLIRSPGASGIILAGKDSDATDHANIHGNVIVSPGVAGISTWWDQKNGIGNRVWRNCATGAPDGAVIRPVGLLLGANWLRERITGLLGGCSEKTFWRAAQAGARWGVGLSR